MIIFKKNYLIVLAEKQTFLREQINIKNYEKIK